MTQELVIPNANEPVPRGWSEEYVLPRVAQIEDPKMLWETAGANIQGLIAQHKARGHDVKELEAGKRFVEIRIGELLGPTSQGQRHDQELSVHAESLQDTDFKHTFKMEVRRLAWYDGKSVKDIAIDGVRNGKRSRGALARYIEEQIPNGNRAKFEPDIRDGDFAKVLADVPDGTVALILTDPPYPSKYLKEWSKLGKFAANKLVDGGSLLAYSGQGNMPEVINRLSEHMRYWWTLALTHGHGSQNLPGKFVTIGWKPILWYVKNKRRDRRYVADRVSGSAARKTAHEWGQGRDELKPLIESLTASGDLIVDPFAGSGTVGEAAVALGRQFIGATKKDE